MFNFLGDFNTTLKKEISDLAHKKDVTKVLANRGLYHRTVKSPKHSTVQNNETDIHLSVGTVA